MYSHECRSPVAEAAHNTAVAVPIFLGCQVHAVASVCVALRLGFSDVEPADEHTGECQAAVIASWRYHGESVNALN